MLYSLVRFAASVYDMWMCDMWALGGPFLVRLLHGSQYEGLDALSPATVGTQFTAGTGVTGVTGATGFTGFGGTVGTVGSAATSSR